MKRLLIIVLLTAASRLSSAAEFEIATKKPDDQIDVNITGGTATFDVRCPSGIGSGRITPAKGEWPETVVLRLHLGGLESISVTNGKLKLSGSVQSHGDNKRQLSLSEEGKKGEQDAGTEIKVLDAAGKPVKGLPGKDGCFEIRLPKALLEGHLKSLEVSWIDFYR